MLISRRTALLSTLALPAIASKGWSQTADKVRLGQPTTSLSYTKIFAARALDSFTPQFEQVSATFK